MRYCIICGEGMFSSNCSVWINNKNYDIHKKCKHIFEYSKSAHEVKKCQ